MIILRCDSRSTEIYLAAPQSNKASAACVVNCAREDSLYTACTAGIMVVLERLCACKVGDIWRTVSVAERAADGRPLVREFAEFDRVGGVVVPRRVTLTSPADGRKLLQGSPVPVWKVGECEAGGGVRRSDGRPVGGGWEHPL